VDSIFSKSTTHLVVGTGELRRTPKLVAAVALGKYVVEESWLRDSQVAGYLLDDSQYIPDDREREREWGFRLREILQTNRAGGASGVLDGYTVHLTTSLLKELKSHGTESDMVGLIKAASAKEVVKKAPRSEPDGQQRTIVVGTDSDAVDGGWRVFTQELIVSSILRGKLDLDNDEFLVKAALGSGGGRGKR